MWGKLQHRPDLIRHNDYLLRSQPPIRYERSSEHAVERTATGRDHDTGL